MKKNEIIFWILRVPLDFIIIYSSFFIARQLRLITDFIPSVNLPIQTIDKNSLSLYAIICSTLLIILFSIHSLYFIKITHSKIKEFLNIIRYSFYSFVFFLVIVFLWKWFIFNTEIPRLIILFSFVIWTTFIILERILLNNIQYFLLKKWFIIKRRIILINNNNSSKIKQIIKDLNDSKIYDILWYINKQKAGKQKIKYLWSISNIKDIFEKKSCEEILYIDSDFSKKDLLKLWELSRIFWIRYRYVTNSFDITKTNTTLSLINKIPVIEIKNTPLDNWWKVLKRIFDIISWILWIILLSPIFIITALLIKIEDIKAPIIYKNKRIWQNGKVFYLYKFRYLKRKYCIKDSYWVNNNEDEAFKFEQELIKKSSLRSWPLYKIKNDPRKTSIWNFIEKYSIDELPQFFNVIIWNMSLVWPRPHQPREVTKYTLEQRRVLTIKPWITWMAQVNGREKNDFKKEAELDIFYIENWNFLIDFKIILKTFSVIFKR